MKNFDTITENYAFKEVAIYNEKKLVIGYRVNRYVKDKNNIFVFDKSVKEVLFNTY